jgi:hypothetical protein
MNLHSVDQRPLQDFQHDVHVTAIPTGLWSAAVGLLEASHDPIGNEVYGVPQPNGSGIVPMWGPAGVCGISFGVGGSNDSLTGVVQLAGLPAIGGPDGELLTGGIEAGFERRRAEHSYLRGCESRYARVRRMIGAQWSKLLRSPRLRLVFSMRGQTRRTLGSCPSGSGLRR